MAHKDRLRLWVQALRSGEYVQGQNKLNANGKYCCLGVACEVAMKNGLDLDIRIGEYATTYYNEIGSDLPTDVSYWYFCNYHVYDPKLGNDLTCIQANDREKYSFKTIANMIESYYNLNED